jgi:hypothetical protein
MLLGISVVATASEAIQADDLSISCMDWRNDRGPFRVAGTTPYQSSSPPWSLSLISIQIDTLLQQ